MSSSTARHDRGVRGSWDYSSTRGESFPLPGPWTSIRSRSRGGPMSGTRIAVGRIVALGVLLAMSLLLLAAAKASAGRYEVAQCGWYVGADASWADTTGGVKFRPDSWCVPPAGADPFDGAHMKSLTRDGQGTVSGTRFARWRWDAPAGTGI